MKVMLDEGAFMPTRAHDTDAGLDLMAKERVKIWPGMSACIDTGVHIELPHGYYGKIESKSGLNVKHNIVSCGGVIDEGYTGSVVVKLYNLGDKAYVFNPGDRVAQLVIQPYIAPELEVTECLSETDRGNNGFGSSGK